MMSRTIQYTLLLTVLAASIAMAETKTPSISVDCNMGQSLNQTLSKLNKHAATTVTVSGTCTEYVQVVGFEDLTLKGMPGATLLQPTTGASNLFYSLLLIESSQSVTVDGFSIQADAVNTPAAVGIGHGSTDIRLRNLSVQGGIFGLFTFEHSQVSLAYVTAKDPGYATLGAFDLSDVHVERSSFQDSTGNPWHVGMQVGSSHITMYGTNISNMQVGINANAGSIIDVLTFNTYYATGGTTDVTISSPAGINNNGVVIDTGGSLNVSTARLVINRPGQTSGGEEGGILLSDGAAMSAANGSLVITNSGGQGIVAVNNSHATIVGATITGGTHGGLVVVNQSSIDLSAGGNLTVVAGNSVDLFCDSNSTITGTANLSGVPTSQCANLLTGETVPLP